MEEKYECAKFKKKVELGDGCTFGTEGAPEYKGVSNEYKVSLNGHEAVDGYHW